MSVVTVNTNEQSHEEWLQSRNKGIGGSDAAAVAGLNKWKSPLIVYMEKTGEVPQPDIFTTNEHGGFESGSEAAYWGVVNEEKVAKEFQMRTGRKVRRRNAILKHPEYDWMLANVDRLIVGSNEGLECKTASQYLKDEWNGDEIPANYLIQCQHYMAVTGAEAWWIAVLIGGNELLYKRVERDEELIEYLIGIEKEFWEDHVLQKVPPEMDGSQAGEEFLKAMYPESEPDSETELASSADELIKEVEEAKKEEKEAAERKKAAENKLKDMLGTYEKGIASNHVVTWKPVTQRRVDSKTLKKECPDIYEKYSKETTSRRMNIKEAK